VNAHGDGHEPFCSVIVPTHRRPDQLAACLQALEHLDYHAFEVIVVDDGGGVPLEPVVERFRARVDVKLVARAERGGPAATRNTGAEAAQGELLAFTDDDCRPAPSWLRLLAARYREEPASAFGGHTVNALVDNPFAGTSQLVIDVGYAHVNAGPETATFFTTNNLAVPAAGFRALGGFDAAFRTAEDRDFCARWVADGRRLAYVPDAIVHHAHDLTLADFCRQHFAYGRGAFRYHREQARRRHTRIGIDASYYRAVAVAPFRRERPMMAIVLTALLGVWHTANTAGFVWAWLRDRRAENGCGVTHLSWSGRVGGIERQLAVMVRAACEREPGSAHACLVDGRGAIGERLAADGLASRLGLTRGWTPIGLWRLARTLRRLRPEVLHLHTHSLGTFLVSAAAIPSTPRVYTEHSPRSLRSGSVKFRALYWLVRRMCVRVVANAPAVACAVEARGVDPQRIRVIPSVLGVPLRGVGREREEGDTVGVVCRLAPVKRVDLLLDVVAELRARGVPCSALVVGDGPERARLEAHAVARGVRGSTSFAGEQADVVPLLDRMDVFVATSEADMYPGAVIEAMARGVPVVALACDGGLRDLAEAGGLLLPSRDVAAAADAVGRLLRSPERREQLRARGLAVAARHAPETVLEAYDELYAELGHDRTGNALAGRRRAGLGPAG
jgi:glycosyltransferase involved in cell wall biosynthesis/GT2 family glycosyltransferase